MTRHGPGCSSGKRWTPEEDDRLRESASTIRFNTMGGVVPGRSRKAVRARMLKLGLYRATARSTGTYTLTAVAEILGVPRGTVREWVDTGKLPHVRVPSLKVQTGRGGRVLIQDVELDAFITQFPFLFSLASFPDGPHKATLRTAHPEDWLSRQQAASALGINPHHLDCLARTGTIASRRFGRPRFYHCTHVAQFRLDRARRLARNAGYRRRWLAHHRKVS